MCSRGTTLIEVVIALLLVALISAAAMSIALTSGQTGRRVALRSAAALTTQRVLESLKAYVTADTTLRRGPGAGPDGWSLPGDRCGCYALSAGVHTLDPLTWAPALVPYGAQLSYTVTTAATPQGPEPTVRLSIAWNDP